MIYRDSNYKKLNINENDLQYIARGSCAKVYLYNDIIFKKYNEDIPYFYRMDLKLFEILKQIKNPHFIELYNIYTRNISFYEYMKTKKDIRYFDTLAYTAKYYPDDKVNILFESKDYLLENLYELEKLFNTFSNLGICVNDTKYSNTILNREKIVLIDPDLYYFDNTEEDLKKKNRILLSTLIKNILINSSPDDEILNNFTKKIAEFTDFDFDSKTELSLQLSRKLTSTNKPIEFFRK